MNTTPTNSNVPSAPAAKPGLFSRLAVPALWMIAGVMLGVALFRGDESSAQDIIRGMANRANAGMVSHSGSYAVLTSESGNEDLVVVLDQRTESILIYRGDLQRGIELQQRLNLPRTFEDARLRTLGKP
jgi:hypothetical protein